MIDLKPCPFCGGEAYYTLNSDSDWECRCFDCGASVKVYGREFTPGRLKKDRKTVIMKWNRRKQRTGEWMESPSGQPYFVCTECGVSVIDKSCYCPSCGAKMKGTEE